MAARPSPWPQAIGELLPLVLFRLAAEHPDITYAMFPINPTNISLGYRKITFAQVANAVHAMAWWFEGNVGKLGEDKKDGSETLVYMGPNDIRYAVLCLGSVVAGYKMLLPSPRYGAEGLAKLIETVDAKVMLVSEMPFPVATEVSEKRGMKRLQIPSVEELLTEKMEPYPFTKTFKAHKNEPLICLHTSGTTGFPKPILWTHDWASSHAQEVAFNAPPDFELAGIQQMPSGSKALFFFPAFHASGVIGMVLLPILRGVVPVYPATWTTWGEAIEGALAAIDVLAKEESEAEGEKKWVVDNVSLPPPCIDYLATHNSLLEQLSQGARTVVWSGGSVSRSAGDALAVKMNVVNALASTEMGVWPFIRRSGTQSIDGLWEYFTPHPALTMRFDSVSETPGGMACEAVMVRNDGLEWDGYVQPLFKVYTDVQEKRLGDLFIQHPEDETLWKHVGRADDLLVFLTSEKFHPAAAERRLASHPAIAEVMMVGTRRPRASLIVRLQGGGREVPEDVWTLIEEVNRDSRVCARVQRNMVLVVDKPFMKTGKGSVQKSAMLDLYGQELDSLYG